MQEAPHPVSPVSHASRYNTLHFASKVVCQWGQAPFGNPGQQNRRYAALSGSIPPFVVSSPFHGLFSPFVKFGVIFLREERPLTPEVLTHWAETLSQPLFGQPFSCTLAQVPSRQEAMEQFENEMRLMR